MTITNTDKMFNLYMPYDKRKSELFKISFFFFYKEIKYFTNVSNILDNRILIISFTNFFHFSIHLSLRVRKILMFWQFLKVLENSNCLHWLLGSLGMISPCVVIIMAPRYCAKRRLNMHHIYIYTYVIYVCVSHICITCIYTQNVHKKFKIWEHEIQDNRYVQVVR